MSVLTSSLLADLYAPIADDLSTVERIFDEELRSEWPFVNDWCDQVRSYRGKMLRPALVLLSGRASGHFTGAHHTLAAVVEMVHMAALVHDDVLDGADERRCRPTIRADAGNQTAVLLGDYLIGHAYHLCSSLDGPYASRRIGAVTNQVCEGEMLQCRRRGDDRLSEAEYIDIIRRKTGALTSVCCELGAAYAGADVETVSALSNYGMGVGVAFQIIDDVLDIVGDPREVGKTLGVDLALGELTLPTIHCLANADRGTAQTLRAIVRGERSCGRDRIREWIETTDSAAYAASVAGDYVREAVERLNVLPLSDARMSLAAVAEFVIERRF